MDFTCLFRVERYNSYGKFFCTVKAITEPITQPYTEIKSIVGTRLPGKESDKLLDDNEVDAFEADNMVINFVPRGIQSFFPGLKRLELTGCGLKEIYRKDLSGLINLTLVDFSSNELKVLPNDLFVDTPELEAMSFEENLLANVNSKLLEPVKGTLNMVNFQNNPGVNVLFREDLSDFDDYNESLNEQGICSCIEDLIELLDKDTSRKTQSNDHLKKYEELLESGSMSDVVLKVEDKVFKSHKLILATQSPVFGSLFNGNQEQSPIINIIDVSAAAVEEFLKFIYTGKIDKIVNEKELCILATKYEIPKLKKSCENIILEGLNFKNAAEVLEYAKLNNLDTLIRAASIVLDLPISPTEPEAKYQEENQSQESKHESPKEEEFKSDKSPKKRELESSESPKEEESDDTPNKKRKLEALEIEKPANVSK